MRLSTILKVIGGLLVLLIIGVGVFIATLDVSQYRGQIAGAIEDATGRRVAIDGEMDLAIGLSPALVVEGVSIGNTDWASDPTMVSVQRLEAQVEVLPLLSGQIRVNRLILVEPVVSLETNAEGTGNWTFGTPDAAAPAGETAPAGADGEAGGGAAQLEIQEVRLRDGALTYRDGVSGQTMRVTLERVSLTGAGLDAPLEVDIAGAYNDAAFTLAGTLGPLAGLTASSAAPWPLDVTATAGGATVTVAGDIAVPAKARGLDLAVSAEGAQLGDLGALLAALGQTQPVPALGPYRVAARVQGDADALALSGLDASLGAMPRLKVTATGAVENVTAVQGLDLAISAEGAEVGALADLAAQVGQPVDVPALGPFAVTATVTGSPDALAVSGLDAAVGEAGRFRATATGAIADALAQSGLDLTVGVDAPDPAVLADLGAPVPVPLNARASLSDITGGYRLRDIQATVGRSTLSGAIDAVLDGPRPAVAGRINAPLLDLNELAGGPAGAAPAPAAPADGSGGGASGGPMIPDTPLPLDALRAADATLTLTADRAVLPGGAEMANVTLGLTLAGGALALDPVQAGIAGGQIAGTVALTPTEGGGARASVDLTGERVALGTLARTFGGTDALEGGPTTLTVSLSGQGATPHQIAGTLTGAVLVHTVDARMNNGAVNWAGGDVFTQLGELINPFGQREPTTPIQCLVFNMTATQGVLSNDHGIALETDKMVVGGGGAFDLGAERLNVKIAPRPRPGIGLETGFGKIVELFAVTGPFASPALELDAQKAVETGLKTAASAAGAVATGGLSLLGENLAGSLLGSSTDGEMEPCLVALGQKDPGEIGAAPAESAAPGTAAPAEAVEEQIQQQIRGVTEGLTEGLPEGTGDRLNEALGGALQGVLGGGGGDSGGAATAPAAAPQTAPEPEQPAQPEQPAPPTESRTVVQPDGSQQPAPSEPQPQQPATPEEAIGDAIREGLGGLLGN
ncbi:AsmA family protein [Roseospira goensis]|uniref:Uncharacterized protein involved in outer membrane biogenesis n=1 Tax=Roseospira goensis TaxID=391922 RepID=A0A7W6S0M8_9PROT|nr:AsmA family protein [Roseospira goensis]MBB4286047.1 uncharacterized protein involved in outer membrane biogenesis [Roseospira goensis]